jgi:hypothetical protein
MKTALKKLLDTLDVIHETHGELLDTEVCEALAAVLYNAYIRPAHGYVVPTSFGMFSPAADALVHTALSEFISEACGIARLRSPQQRLESFQDDSVVSASGRTYRCYFGHEDEDPYLEIKKRDEYFGFKPKDRDV